MPEDQYLRCDMWQAMQHLTTLDISGCHKLTDLSALCYCTRLQKLVMWQVCTGYLCCPERSRSDKQFLSQPPTYGNASGADKEAQQLLMRRWEAYPRMRVFNSSVSFLSSLKVLTCRCNCFVHACVLRNECTLCVHIASNYSCIGTSLGEQESCDGCGIEDRRQTSAKHLKQPEQLAASNQDAPRSVSKRRQCHLSASLRSTIHTSCPPALPFRLSACRYLWLLAKMHCYLR